MKAIDSLRRRGLLGALSAGVLGAAGARAAFAQATAASAWPGKPVRIVVPFTPGTGMDILARTLGPHLQAAWGQAIVVDNRPGASGNLGAGAVAKSPPDGLTLLMGVNTLIINPALYSNMTLRPAQGPGADRPARDRLVPARRRRRRRAQVGRRARQGGARAARRARLRVARHRDAASHGDGAVQAARQGRRSRTSRSPAPRGAVNAVLSGDVPLMFLPVHVAMAQVKGGRLVVLAAAGDRRSTLAPDVPTLAELGLPGVEADLWYGMLAPAGTPRDIVVRINADMTKALALPEVPRRARRAGHGGRAELARGHGRADAAATPRAGPAVVKQAGIKARIGERRIAANEEIDADPPLRLARARLRRLARHRRDPAALDADRRQGPARALALAEPRLAGAAVRQRARPRHFADPRRRRHVWRSTSTSSTTAWSCARRMAPDRGFALEPMSVADVLRRFMAELAAAGVEVRDQSAAERGADADPLSRRRACTPPTTRRRCTRSGARWCRPTACSGCSAPRFLGKASPVHFFWGSFDLAVTRFSGRAGAAASGRQSRACRTR